MKELIQMILPLLAQKNNIYYFCAKQFGWDQHKVDEQRPSYLKALIEMHNKEVQKANNAPKPGFKEELRGSNYAH